MGRINIIKGLDILVRAFALARAHLPRNTFLVIVGPDDGYLKPLLRLIAQTKLEERTIITGPLYGLAKRDALQDADAVILPSRYETFSFAILETYAFGKPLIASRTGGIPEEVVDEKTGLLFEAGDVLGLASRLERLLWDPSLAQSLGTAGREFVRQNFSLSKSVTLLEELYTQVLRLR